MWRSCSAPSLSPKPVLRTLKQPTTRPRNAPRRTWSRPTGAAGRGPVLPSPQPAPLVTLAAVRQVARWNRSSRSGHSGESPTRTGRAWAGNGCEDNHPACSASARWPASGPSHDLDGPHAPELLLARAARTPRAEPQCRRRMAASFCGRGGPPWSTRPLRESNANGRSSCRRKDASLQGPNPTCHGPARRYAAKATDATGYRLASRSPICVGRSGWRRSRTR